MPFSWFERRVDPYPEAAPGPAPRGFFAFLWAGTEGMRPFILGMMLLTASIGAFEALLFAMLGKVVDWLAAVEPSRGKAYPAARSTAPGLRGTKPASTRGWSSN